MATVPSRAQQTTTIRTGLLYVFSWEFAFPMWELYGKDDLVSRVRAVVHADQQLRSRNEHLAEQRISALPRSGSRALADHRT